MKQKTEADAYLTLAALCAQAEHCQHEMLEKMRRWELPEEEQARVMQRLVSERYVDDERYARAFVKDKVRYNKWGRRKVEQALWQKHIDDDIRQRVLDEVDDEEYLDVLRPFSSRSAAVLKPPATTNLTRNWCALPSVAALHTTLSVSAWTSAKSLKTTISNNGL